MGVIKADDIMGYFVGQECVCASCVSKDEKAEATQDKIITRNVVEEGDQLYFCDRCDEPIASTRIMRLLSPVRSERK